MYNIGIDLGGTKIAAAIVDEQGQILRKATTPTIKEKDYKGLVEDMASLALQLLEEEGLTKDCIHSIGIGAPGSADPHKGMVIYANNLNMTNAPVREAFSAYFDQPIFIENDANAAAYGEYVAGVGSNYKQFITITLGTGVGSGIIINNQLISGAFFGGSEVGHMVIDDDGALCTCGRKGCWEEYSSATALIKEAKKQALAHPDSQLMTLVGGDIDKITAKIPFDAAQAGDEVAGGVIEWYMKYLAIGLTNIINIFQPEAIALGGGVSAQKEQLLAPLREKIKQQVYGGEVEMKTDLLICELGNDAGLVGAAMLYKVYGSRVEEVKMRL